MDIAALSAMMAHTNLHRDVDTAVSKLAMDAQESSSQNIVDMMQETTAELQKSVNPHLGNNIDLKL